MRAAWKRLKMRSLKSSKFHYSYVYITTPIDTLEYREDVDMEIERNPVLDFDTENAVDPLLRETYAALPAVR